MSTRTKAKPPFVTFVLDQIEGLGTATSRAMFGGHGIYVDGIIVGLVDEEVLYLKVDDANLPRFEEAGGKPFTYMHKEKGSVAMSYWTIPAEVLEDPEQLSEWARTSLEASLRSKTKKPAKAKKAAAG